jgi:hypothetical protein
MCRNWRRLLESVVTVGVVRRGSAVGRVGTIARVGTISGLGWRLVWLRWWLSFRFVIAVAVTA